MTLTFTWNKWARFWALVTISYLIAIFALGCVASWTSEATQIVQLLVPAISSVLSILSAFGVGLPATALTSIQSWANQATTDLQTIAGLIDQYNAAEATAQPGILVEIQTVLSTITSNLSTILPEIHVTDASTQAKIEAIVNLVANELQALVNLIPALQGKVTSHDELKTLMSAVKSPKEFKSEFNTAVRGFGAQYELK